MTPTEALESIAYLLEEELAPSYKVRAFRRAASAVRELEPARLEELHRAGRLKSLAGVGDATATVIAEALSGVHPSYLTALERRRRPAPTGAAGTLLAALRGDCHLHSDWSDGSSPIAEMAIAAAALGHEYAVLTDHSPRLTIAHGLSAERLVHQRAVLAELAPRLAPFRLLSGIEVDILEDGGLDQDEGLLGELDLVVASVHSKLAMERQAMTARMIAAVRNPQVNILGHVTGRLVTGRARPASDFDAQAVFAACARSQTAIEINCRPERQDPPDELLALGAAAGCLFSIDTDAHAPGQLGWQRLGCERAAAAGITAERVVNTWALADLVGWAGR